MAETFDNRSRRTGDGSQEGSARRPVAVSRPVGCHPVDENFAGWIANAGANLLNTRSEAASHAAATADACRCHQDFIDHERAAIRAQRDAGRLAAIERLADEAPAARKLWERL